MLVVAVVVVVVVMVVVVVVVVAVASTVFYSMKIIKISHANYTPSTQHLTTIYLSDLIITEWLRIYFTLIYTSYVRSCVIHGSEKNPMKNEH